MGMNHTPTGERVHIGLFGRRNAGKSSILNAITNQKLAIVSETAGTTTDPVLKTMELLPLGPVVLIDTPGLDDTGELGQKRIEKSEQMLAKTDIALLIIDSTLGKTKEDLLIEEKIKEKKIPYLCVYNKCDLISVNSTGDEIYVSTKTRKNLDLLLKRIAELGKTTPMPIIGDIVHENDTVILVVPIDKAAPKGRLILPQQQTIRELLDIGALTMIVKESELRPALSNITPKLVITDSQVFKEVDRIVPKDIWLTSFSILMARHKGNFDEALANVKALSTVTNFSHILICEGCSHHRQCGDIGTEKLPKWIENFTGCKPQFSFTSGTEFPKDLSPYHIVIHCGGCMLNEREMQYRYHCAKIANIPMTNYGLAISYMNHILERSTECFKKTTDCSQ